MSFRPQPELAPYAAHPEFLRHADTMRDAFRFVAAAHPSLDQPTREDFEEGVLALDAFDDDYDRGHWQRVLGRLLKLIPTLLIATAAMRARRAELEASDALHELVRHTPSDGASPALATLWAETSKLLASLDLHGDALNEHVSHSAWGHIANAADRVAEAPAYQPGDGRKIPTPMAG